MLAVRDVALCDFVDFAESYVVNGLSSFVMTSAPRFVTRRFAVAVAAECDADGALRAGLAVTDTRTAQVRVCVSSGWSRTPTDLGAVLAHAAGLCAWAATEEGDVADLAAHLHAAHARASAPAPEPALVRNAAPWAHSSSHESVSPTWSEGPARSTEHISHATRTNPSNASSVSSPRWLQCSRCLV